MIYHHFLMFETMDVVYQTVLGCPVISLQAGGFVNQAMSFQTLEVETKLLSNPSDFATWGISDCTMGFLTGGFKYLLFHLYLGKWSNLTNIFQMGWNHQPVFFRLLTTQTTSEDLKWNEPQTVGAVEKTQLNSKIKTQPKGGEKKHHFQLRQLLGWKLRRRNIDPGSGIPVFFFGKNGPSMI